MFASVGFECETVLSRRVRREARLTSSATDQAELRFRRGGAIAMGMRLIGRRGLVAGFAALAGAAFARLTSPDRVQAAVNPVQTDSKALSANDTQINNTGVRGTTIG